MRSASASYASEYAARLKVARVDNDIAVLKSRLQRTNPVDNQAEYNKMFARLLELETRRRALRSLAVGD